MTHHNHSKTPRTKRLPALALCAALIAPALVPVAALAHSDARAGLTVDVRGLKVGHVHDHRYDRYRDRVADRRFLRRGGDRYDRIGSRYNTRYFVRPWEPLNFKHWWRVERVKCRYTPNLSRLNRFERREALAHGYDRYLRDHRRWSKRMERRHRNANRDRFLAYEDRRRDRNRRW
ncbi:MAG: hypothetical protein AAGI15_06685 [Pseudomonadota bacterium]